MSSKADNDKIVICILLFYILMFFIIFQYYDNVMQILLLSNAKSANMLYYDPSIQLSEIRRPWPRSTLCSKKWGVSRPRWPRGSDATGFIDSMFNMYMHMKM